MEEASLEEVVVVVWEDKEVVEEEEEEAAHWNEETFCWAQMPSHILQKHSLKCVSTERVRSSFTYAMLDVSFWIKFKNR